jgi:hypothetical protein
MKLLEYSKERHGANYKSKRSGINQEMKGYRVAFTMHSYTTKTTTKENTKHIMDNSPNQI